MRSFAHIRKAVFGVTQAEMASIVRVSQATVSRWEAGEGSPTAKDMRRIRNSAIKRGLVWNDRWFFELPQAAE